MEQHNRIKNIACFLTDYSTALLACGASSVRIEKNVARIAETYDVKAELSILTNHIILTVWDNKSDHSYSNVGKTKNSTISFYINTELSRLSWRIHDNYLELEKACKEYDRIINHPKINRWLVLLLVGFANASFCRLFGGDALAMLVVFIATCVGYCLKIKLLEWKWDTRIVTIASAYCSTIIGCMCYVYELGHTPELAVGTSVLYLVPGIPFINSITDLIYGHNVCFVSRLIHASVITVCLSLGLCLGLVSMNFNLMQ